MLIVIYRKTDALPLMKLGQASTQILQQLKQFAAVMSTEKSKTSVARIENQLVTYMSTDRFIFVIHDSKQQQRLIQLLEEQFSLQYSSKVNAVTREYQFDEFQYKADEIMQKVNSQSELAQLNTETEEVKQIVQENLENIIKRGTNLSKMESDSVQLLDGTKQILGNAKELDMLAFWRRYAIWIVVGGILMIWMLIKIL
ncbi:R-SNARE_1 [Hexamita inflata]|uniref:R-SNARE 1 n=1 Tax=Hexamita inflata TaxID=28002 RepID=A0AA86TXC0_9EUKA|nr:R-SNARE 1 [Hexamita inflata]